ncbi:MAG: putative lipid II flippase FtsW [Candidatus Paceibacterota bacterium]
MTRKIDRPFLIAVIVLLVVGFFIFASASFSLLAREGARFSSVAFSQLVFGIFGGSIALIILSNINYKIWRKHAFYIFIGSVLLTLLVFVPGIGLEYNGATRWLSVGPFTFQPAEFLKLGFVMYFASWLVTNRDRLTKSMTTGVISIVAFVGVVGAILLAQPDTDTFLVIAAAAIAMFIAAGGRWRDLGILSIILLIGIAVIAFSRPYIQERIATFLDPSLDPQGSSYQIQQSLIAIGSGEIFGRGFGQSVQKFNYLPEPIGDSIFSVAAEEFGFVGAVFLVGLFLFFAIRGLRIATRAPDYFSGLLVVGIVILITSQAFVNIGSMLGLIPITGLPLPFVSHGGSALFLTLASVGVVLNISKYMRT